jgi:hypothetical protein
MPREKTMKRLTAILGLSLALAATAADARVFRPKTVRLVLKHTNGLVEAQTLGGQTLDATSLSAAEPLEVRLAQTVELVIDDPNPVLFTYEWGGITYTENTDYQAALAFAKSLNSLLGLISPKTGGRESGRVGEALDESKRKEFEDRIEELRGYIAAIPALAARGANHLALEHDQAARKR